MQGCCGGQQLIISLVCASFSLLLKYLLISACTICAALLPCGFSLHWAVGQWWVSCILCTVAYCIDKSGKHPTSLFSGLCFCWQTNPVKYKDLVPAFASLQNIIIEGKLAPDYDYHGVASPWIQIKLLKMLGLLGADDQRWAQEPLIGYPLRL